MTTSGPAAAAAPAAELTVAHGAFVATPAASAPRSAPVAAAGAGGDAAASVLLLGMAAEAAHGALVTTPVSAPVDRLSDHFGGQLGWW